MQFDNAPAPDLAAIDAMAASVLAELPDIYRKAAAEVVIQVADFPTEHMLAELEAEDAYEITGLYDGVPLTEKSVMDQPMGPDTIWLFRRAILDEWADRGNVTLGALVRNVLVHELAHHFGWSDDDIAQIDRWWE